jgi:hypothetical protein
MKTAASQNIDVCFYVFAFVLAFALALFLEAASVSGAALHQG